jgi:hypothetical protein
MRRAVLLVVIGLLAAGVAGCGGSGEPTPEAYAEAVLIARDRTDFALARIVKATSQEELLNRMDEASDTIDTAANDLEGVGVPADYLPAGERLVTQLEQLAFDVGATADQIRQPGFEDLYEGTRGLSFNSWDKVNLQLARLAGKGVPVVILQRHTADS